MTVKVVDMSKFIDATEASKEILWVKKFLNKFDYKQDRYMVYCYSQNVIHLSKNASFH